MPRRRGVVNVVTIDFAAVGTLFPCTCDTDWCKCHNRLLSEASIEAGLCATCRLLGHESSLEEDRPGDGHPQAQQP